MSLLPVCIILTILMLILYTTTLVLHKSRIERRLNIYTCLDNLHRDVVGVDMSHEINEQHLIFEHLPRDSKVLEFGGNIGRSSIVINKLLNNPSQHVVLESDHDIAKILEKNRDSNNCKFKVVPAALSDYPLIQQGWLTKIHESSAVPDGWHRVRTVGYKELQNMHNITFDTLVVDCEGCLAGILQQNEDFLKSIKTIIIEHDDIFNSAVPQNYIRPELLKHRFHSVAQRDYDKHKCFWEVLKKNR